jgi:pimeloyl-ACP methyl ester carboxylesterase
MSSRWRTTRSVPPADVGCSSFRHRLGQAVGAASYDRQERTLAAAPVITVPAVTLDGMADGNFPATDGTTSAARFTGPRVHHQVPKAGHNLPQEAPFMFAQAVIEVSELAAQVGR